MGGKELAKWSGEPEELAAWVEELAAWGGGVSNMRRPRAIF